jgi:hypothetical protein
MEEEAGTQPVWARGSVALGTCPRSFITAESITLLEEFAMWRQLGGDAGKLTAKQVDGFAILERMLAKELKNGRPGNRSIAGDIS